MLHDILINQIPIKNIKEMSLLENDPEKNNYLIAIAEMENVALRTMDSDFLELIDIDREFGEKLERITGTENDCFLFKSGNCERLLCIEASNPQTLERKQSQIMVKVKTKQEEPYSILISFGTIRQGLYGMHKSYLEAREKQTNKDMKAWTSAIYPENKPINFTEFDTRALATEVQTGTRAGIDEQLKQLEDTLRSKGMTSHMFVMMVVSDIFFQIIKLPEGVEGYSNEILENPIDYYQKIINQKDLNGIFDYLAKICYQINDFFADINSGKLTGVLKRALGFIDSNFAREDLMIKDVAQYVYVSSSYLSIILKKEMGITFIEYLTKVRMEHAKKLLEENRLKQYEIAEACGYSNSTYFSTIFKRYFGVSPSGYLNKAKDDSQKG
jgi:YesN/AraC family two-component response regulator